MITRRSAKKKSDELTLKTTYAASALLNNIAEASCQAIGLSKKKMSAVALCLRKASR